MNPEELMRRALQSGDFSNATVHAALDALMESGERTLIMAVNAIALECRCYWDAKELDRATRLLAKGSPVRNYLTACISSTLPVRVYDVFDLVVVGGDQRGRWVRGQRGSVGTARIRNATVGAAFVINLAMNADVPDYVRNWVARVLSS